MNFFLSDKNLKKRLFFLVFLFVIFALPAFAERVDNPICGISPAPNRIIVEFDGEVIRAEYGEEFAKTGPFNVSIPQGLYDVTLTTYDDHSDKYQPDQTHEEWFLKLQNFSGNTFQETSSISDLSDDADYLTEKVNTQLNITQNIHSITAFHSEWWVPGNPHSLVPVCAAFDLIPPPPAPTCTLSANPTSIVNGESSTLSWTTSNATSVSLNQGIGAVNANGSTSVSPSDTTTYTLTATGAGGTITCNAGVTVTIVPPPPAPTCTLSANPTSIVNGESSTLSWVTSNAFAVDLVGPDFGVTDLSLNGSFNVSPIVTSDYTLTATGAGGTVTCNAGVTVTIVPPPPAPTCTLSANPTMILNGESSTLSWTTTNTTSIVLSGPDFTIADLPPNGSHNVSPTVVSDYSINVGSGIICEATVTVTIVPPPPSPTCTLSANPTSIAEGNSSTLSWTTSNATVASLNQGIGAIGANGSTSVSPSDTTTYTLTATGAGGTITCNAGVTVSLIPLADVSITKSVTPDQVQKSGHFTYTLVYENTGSSDAENVTIEDIVNPTGLLTGLTILSGPPHGTCTANSNGIDCDLGTLPLGEGGEITYKATGSEIGIIDNTAVITTTTDEVDVTNNEDSEQVSVFILSPPVCTINCGGGGGGGMNPPNVIMFSKPGPQLFSSKSFIYLSQIPYTGVTGSLKGMVFIFSLSLWSAIIAYHIVKKKIFPRLITNNGFSAEDFPIQDEDNRLGIVSSVKEIIEMKDFMPVKNIPYNGHNLPIWNKGPENDEIKHLISRAEDQKVLISEDAVKVLSLLRCMEDENEEVLLSQVIEVSKTIYPREDGWIILDKKRIEKVILSPRLNVVTKFSNWLAVGKEKEVFNFLETLGIHNFPIKEFLKETTYFTDNLFKSKTNGKLDNGYQTIDFGTQCVNWTDKDIEKVRDLLVEINELSEASIKLNLSRILDIARNSEIGGSYFKEEEI